MYIDGQGRRQGPNNNVTPAANRFNAVSSKALIEGTILMITAKMSCVIYLIIKLEHLATTTSNRSAQMDRLKNDGGKTTRNQQQIALILSHQSDLSVPYVPKDSHEGSI